jgi:hypothetical protein
MYGYEMEIFLRQKRKKNLLWSFYPLSARLGEKLELGSICASPWEQGSHGRNGSSV